MTLKWKNHNTVILVSNSLLKVYCKTAIGTVTLFPLNDKNGKIVMKYTFNEKNKNINKRAETVEIE